MACVMVDDERCGGGRAGGVADRADGERKLTCGGVRSEGGVGGVCGVAVGMVERGWNLSKEE